MRNRTNSFWGRRALCTVSIPLTAYPSSPPPFEPPGKVIEFEGTWERREGRTLRLFTIGRIQGSAPPKEGDKRCPFVVFVEPEDRGPIVWWEGQETIYDCDPDKEFHEGQLLERRPMDVALVHAYKEREDWLNRHVPGRYSSHGEYFRAPWYDGLNHAANCAKTTYHAFEKDRLLVTYSVKWFYPARKYRFCAELARALEQAKACGIDVRLRRRT
jgi:hypothetical protein